MLLLMIRIYSIAIVSALVAFSQFSASGRERQTWESQPYRYEIRIGWGAPSDTPGLVYRSGMNSSTGGVLSQIYSPKRGGLYSTGGISAELGLNFRKWFTLAFQTSFTGTWSDVLSYDGRDVLNRERGVVFNLAPQLRFNWVSRPTCRFYSSLGAGVTVASHGGKTEVLSSFQYVPLGMALGKDVFFFAELGGGVDINFVGCNLGFGYRF